jgi:hypothetical protein
MKIPKLGGKIATPKFKAPVSRAPGAKNSAPRLHRPRMGAIGHTAFPPTSDLAFSEPSPKGGMAFSPAEAGAGAGGGMASGGEAEEAAKAEGEP